MPKIAVFGGTGYLASILKNQNNVKKNKYHFFSRKKKSKEYFNIFDSKKILKNFDYAIHLIGPDQNKLLKKNNLIKIKNNVTSSICDLCLNNNIKLIYISSMKVYKDYGKNDILINSKINYKNPYSKAHIQSEKIIIKKFSNHKDMYTILRVGHVFGFKKYLNLREINKNIIHGLCISAIKKNNIVIHDNSIQRSFVPSQIFVKVINFIITNNFFKNSVINISYKNFYLYDIAKIIKKMLKLNINIKVKKFCQIKKISVYSNRNFKFYPNIKKIYFEINQIVKNVKKLP